MVISSPAGFASAVAAHVFDDIAFEPETIEAAAASVALGGLLVVGEPHGVRETPSVLYALAVALGTSALALEWSHEEMDRPVQDFVAGGSFDFESLWRLPPTAEFFCGDGRITAGHFALLDRLRHEGRLDQAIVFDRLDPEPPPEDWRVRDREMAARLLTEWDRSLPLLVATGAFHAQVDSVVKDNMAAHLARAVSGLQPAMLEYASGSCWSRSERHEISGSMPDAPITVRVPNATPAIVPGPPSE